MGGNGSGRYGGRPTIQATASYVLDVASFKRAGVLRRGLYAELSCAYDDGDFPLAMRLDGRGPGLPFLELRHDTRTVSVPAESVIYRVFFTTTRPHFGGERWWFICPADGRRVRKLYLPLGGHRFLSRRAYRLDYACQRETPLDRACRKARKLQRALGGDRQSAGDDIPPKRKWMRWGTYERRVDALIDAELRADELFALSAARLLARLGVRAIE